MKRLFVMLVLFALSMAITAIPPGKITVTKPFDNEIVYKGSIYLIKWDHDPSVTSNVKIRLFDKTGITQIYKIVETIPISAGQYLWPSNLLDNTNLGDYVIRIKTIDNLISDDSSVFHIKQKGGMTPIFHAPKLQKESVVHISDLIKLIQVTSPVNNMAYEVNKAMLIQWNKNFSSYASVNIALYGDDNSLKETLFTAINNSGSTGWSPPGKYSWPGTKYYIKVFTSDNKFGGKSGIFTIVNPVVTPPPAPSKKVIAITPVISNKSTPNQGNNGEHDCLFAQQPLPGRAPNSAEIKTGHYREAGKHKKCNWWIEYYFHSDLTFDLSAIKGKEVIRAELMLSLSEDIMKSPSGTLGTNEYCNSSSKIFEGGNLVKTFSIFDIGVKTKIDLLNSVKNWAVSNPATQYKLMIKGMMDYVPNMTSVCLKYYNGPLLFVEYKE